MQVFITKYALTNGIFEREAELCEAKMVRCKSLYSVEYYHGNDWYESFEDAKVQAELMRDKKITALERQIKKLEAMKFEMPK